MEQAARQKENIKAGTEVSTVDLLKMVGSLAKDHITRVRVPALTFSFPRMMSDYWGAFWNGRTLPFKFTINGEVQKETFIGRLGFAVTFIIADSVYLVGRFGVWALKRLPWKLNVWNMVLVAGLAVGFLGWVLPWWLEGMNFMKEIEQTKTMQALHDIDLTIPQIPEVGLNVGWLGLVPLVGMIGTVPFSVVRFKKWRGFKSVLRKKSKPIIGDDENEISKNS